MRVSDWSSDVCSSDLAAIASMGLFAWLPINWHLAGPIGLFESIMVTLALGLNLKKIRADKLAADTNYARALAERLTISTNAARPARAKDLPPAPANSQNALLHAPSPHRTHAPVALNTPTREAGPAQTQHT